jgi:N-methylhydantoinase A
VFDGRAHECSIYDRPRLAPGDAIAGPAIVEEYGATTVVYPGQRAEVDRLGNVILAHA